MVPTAFILVKTGTSVTAPHVLSTPTEAARAGAEHVLAAARSAVAQRGRFVMALSGGGTPALLYRLLASPPYAQAMPWTATHLLWSDERWMPPDHADSNFAMAREALLAHVPLLEAQTHPIETVGLTPEESAVRYEQSVRALIGRREPRLDLALLGIGEDGHTASLFPGAKAVNERRQLVVANHVPSLGAWRITMTLPLLNAAREILFLVTGPAKAQALRRVLEPTPSGDALPAALVRPADGRLTWLVDREAASLLSPLND